MGTTLTGTTPQDTYDSLIKVTDNGPLTGSLKKLTDGLGNDSSLSLSTTAASLSGTLAVTSGLTAATGSFLGSSANGTLRAEIAVESPASNNAALIAKTSNGGNDVFRWFDGATQLGVFKNSGNVGIGTDAPTAMLTLKSVSPFIRIERDGVPTWQIQNNTLINDAGFSINNATTVATPFFINGTTNQVGILNANPLQPLDVTGNIRSSTGILFGADTAAANLLDDYEEGTWTMGVSFGGASVGVTYATNTGTYTKIGRKVTVNGYLGLSNKGSSTGIVRVTGLPFAIGNSSNNYSAPSFYIDGNITFVGQIQGFGDFGGTTILLGQATELGVTSILTDVNFANNSALIVSFTYFV
jgi:hypothetical protein